MQLKRSTSSTEGGSYGRSTESATGKVIPFPTASGTSIAQSYLPTDTPTFPRREASQRPAPLYRHPESLALEIGERKLDIQAREIEDKWLREVFFLIFDACDASLGIVERSNCFDDWKELLSILSRKANSLSIKHRKILGSLIVATKNKDVVDFPLESLMVLKEATYILRQYSISRRDCNKIIESISQANMQQTINLAPDGLSDEHVKRLDEMMQALIEKSNE